VILNKVDRLKEERKNIIVIFGPEEKTKERNDDTLKVVKTFWKRF
jgi:hypothetical protein